MRKILPFALLLCFVLPVWADEQTRQIQSALTEAGFYYGTVDGKMGEDTRAALRRFQIRNGLDVSGEASAETLSVLKIQKSVSPAARDEEQVASSVKPSEPASDQSDRLSENTVPQQAGPRIGDSFDRSPARDFFTGTDLADASTAEQTRALMRAQTQLSALGYYHSAPDGLPREETETALLRFQHAFQLRLTARLDSDTRRALIEAPPSVPSKPFRSSKNRPPGVVLRGIWVH